MSVNEAVHRMTRVELVESSSGQSLGLYCFVLVPRQGERLDVSWNGFTTRMVVLEVRHAIGPRRPDPEGGPLSRLHSIQLIVAELKNYAA